MGANVRPPRRSEAGSSAELDRPQLAGPRGRSSMRPRTHTPSPPAAFHWTSSQVNSAAYHSTSHSSRTMSTAAAPHAFVILRFSDKNRFGKNGVPALRPYSGGQRCVIRMKEATLEKACAAPAPPHHRLARQPTPYATQGQAGPVRQGGAGGRQHGGPPHGAARQRRRVPSRAAGVPAPRRVLLWVFAVPLGIRQVRGYGRSGGPNRKFDPAGVPAPLRDQAVPLPSGRVVGAAAGGGA